MAIKGQKFKYYPLAVKKRGNPITYCGEVDVPTDHRAFGNPG
ncbi:hypothetical protein A6764_17725 [Brevibacillus sp. WF146]|nr:hypothetical protein [Brevibacillus sp. WF146]UYZ15653.1 hypothetical protein A6764_17725 [Brevibacillus sp. WF146]